MTDRPSLLSAREIVSRLLPQPETAEHASGEILNQAWRDELTAKIANAIDATVTLATVGELPSAYAIGPCADCRFWESPQGATAKDLQNPTWGDCAKAREPDARMIFDPQGWHSDGGAVMTAPDFGCVQFERKESDGDRQ